MEELRTLAAGPYLTDRFWAAFLLGEMARERGGCSEPVRWLEQAASVPPHYDHLHFRVYSEPGMIQSLATCYEEMGDLAKAMRERLAAAAAGAGSPR